MKTIVFIVIAIPAILIALLILKGIDHLVLVNIYDNTLIS